MLANNVNLTIFGGGVANKPARLNMEHKPSGNYRGQNQVPHTGRLHSSADCSSKWSLVMHENLSHALGPQADKRHYVSSERGTVLIPTLIDTETIHQGTFWTVAPDRTMS